jgi:hypothetical protein
MGTTRTSTKARRRRSAAVCAVFACGWLLTAPWAGAQDAAPQQPAPPPSRPGLFEAIGRWVDRGASSFTDHLRGAKRSMDDLGDKAAANSKEMGEQAAKVGQGAAEVGKGAAEVTRNAVDAVVKLPTARMMSGRERCVEAPNGAPDCVAAAEALCRKHGYASGKSMDFTSAEECPIRTLAGETSRDQCVTVTFISRAMCQ